MRAHIEAATTSCFTAILVGEAATDARERAFLNDPEEVMAAWARASSSSGVTRVIWVTGDEPPKTTTREVTNVDPADPNFVSRIVELDDAQVIS